MVTRGTLGVVKYVLFSVTTPYVKLFFLTGGPQVKVHDTSSLEQSVKVVEYLQTSQAITMM